MKITPQEIAEHKARFANAKSAPMRCWVEGNMDVREFNIYKYKLKRTNPLSFEMFFKIFGMLKQHNGRTCGGRKANSPVGKNDLLKEIRF